MCPRCGGELASAARHRAEMAARARKQARRYVATGAGLVLFVLAAIAWLVFGPGVARADEKPAAANAAAPTTANKPKPKAATPAAKPKTEKVATAAPARPIEPAAEDATADAMMLPRPVRVRLLDGSTVVGTVHAEEAATLVVDCSLGTLSIPRARISTIAYDAAAGVGQKRAPVQQLDDEDKPTPTRKRSSSSSQ